MKVTQELGGITLFFTKKPKSWNEYTKIIQEADLHVGNRPTERLEFLNITEETLADVREAATYLLSYKDQIIDKFYDNITASEHLNEIIAEQFLAANIDEEYIRSRVIVGEVHSRINLTANHFIMAHDLLLN